MPFPQQPNQLFNRSEVESLKSGQSGVYGLYRPGQWIYVGKGDIRQRLLDHLNGDNACITRLRPTNWQAAVTANMDEKERQLIAELDPVCNRRIG